MTKSNTESGPGRFVPGALSPLLVSPGTGPQARGCPRRASPVVPAGGGCGHPPRCQRPSLIRVLGNRTIVLLMTLWQRSD